MLNFSKSKVGFYIFNIGVIVTIVSLFTKTFLNISNGIALIAILLITIGFAMNLTNFFTDSIIAYFVIFISFIFKFFAGNEDVLSSFASLFLIVILFIFSSRFTFLVYRKWLFITP